MLWTYFRIVSWTFFPTPCKWTFFPTVDVFSVAVFSVDFFFPNTIDSIAFRLHTGIHLDQHNSLQDYVEQVKRSTRERKTTASLPQLRASWSWWRDRYSWLHVYCGQDTSEDCFSGILGQAAVLVSDLHPDWFLTLCREKHKFLLLQWVKLMSSISTLSHIHTYCCLLMLQVVWKFWTRIL